MVLSLLAPRLEGGAAVHAATAPIKPKPNGQTELGYSRCEELASLCDALDSRSEGRRHAFQRGSCGVDAAGLDVGGGRGEGGGPPPEVCELLEWG